MSHHPNAWGIRNATEFLLWEVRSYCPTPGWVTAAGREGEMPSQGHGRDKGASLPWRWCSFPPAPRGSGVFGGGRLWRQDSAVQRILSKLAPPWAIPRVLFLSATDGQAECLEDYVLSVIDNNLWIKRPWKWILLAAFVECSLQSVAGCLHELLFPSFAKLTSSLH